MYYVGAMGKSSILEGESNLKEKFNNYSNESENSIPAATSSGYRTVKINSSR